MASGAPHAESLVAPFSELDHRDLALVGGKGANLGELTRAGFPVPAGFCVTTVAFRLFLQGAGDTTQMFADLAAVNPEDTSAIRHLGEAVRSRLRQVSIPDAVTAAVAGAWRGAGAENAYAVRSSATAEDLPGTSFAGQQDTYLNVRGQNDLLEKVRACWISLFTDRAITYRQKNGFGHRRVFLSVIVQRMVFPDVSGILFTADPIDGRRHIVSIDAGFGLGEALVSGLVSADLYKVDKRSGAIVERKIATKTLAIWPTAEGGTEQKPIAGDRRTASSLTDEQVRALAALGARIEAHYQAPQDIEWCIEAGAISVVQSRPITTLYPLPEAPAPGAPLKVYISFSHAQVMTDALPPYAASIWRHVVPFGRDANGLSHTMLTAGGRLYLDPSDLLRVSPIGKAFAGILKAADELIASAVADVIARPEFAYGSGSKISALTSVVPFMSPVIGRALWRLCVATPEGNAARTSAFVDATIATARAKLEPAPPGAERYQVACDLHGRVFEGAFLQIVPTVLSGVLGLLILRKLLAGRGVDRELLTLAQGLDGNVATEMDMQLGDVADVARAHPAVVSHLKNADPRQVLTTVRSVEGGAAFANALQAFLQRYGMRCGSEIDISRPRWSEDPTPLIQILIGNLAREEPRTHRVHHAQLKKQGLDAAEALVRAASPLTRPLVRRLVRVCRHNLAIREHPKFLLVQWLAMMKTVTLHCADVLVREGRLRTRADVFFLTMPEIRQAMRAMSTAPRGNVPDFDSLVSQRQDEHRHNQKLTPPRVMTSEGERVISRHATDHLPANAVAGTAASPGIAEGRAKVVRDPSTAILEAGEILVAPFTDPGWTPLFINAKGLVMEVGGLMTHGSVVAREYGIPAVVSVPDATTIIRTGQMIRVNGDEGFVEIL